jgi:hypothetical protein
MDTIDDEYEPDAASFVLEAHNLATYKQQLICLVGAIGIARPDSLVM